MNLEQNRRVWDAEFDWRAERDGEDWSLPWGDSETQWTSALLPRIRRFVPTGTILEIGPGRGRWTRFLKDYCERLIIVDLSPACIEACRARFGSDGHIAYHVNDGVSLEMVPDHSVDFVFSFDSLVHAEPRVIDAYLSLLARKLTAAGAGFVHHSNLGAYRWLTWLRRLSRGPLKTVVPRVLLLFIDEAWRDRSMTAKRFRASCLRSGLTCTAQELVNWVGTSRLIDCMSTFRPAHAVPAASPRVVRNRQFMDEAARAKRSTVRVQTP